ncbi:hypothetical protein PVAND_000395 [Polypedilum vanderplanki]|uniref:Uncharacterized protein n=1 Tax=Polypedilum vanderplanki TaxID=319348 RepID=A0A9J6BK70_POLVA|nr:hypothetical protein PVAND_000395 [Polypedilum vanderplanki]
MSKKDRDVEASKSFLQSERGSSSSSATVSTSGRKSPIEELIKCFCGVCESWFKRKSIIFALKSNGDEILRDAESREILKKFLKYRQTTRNLLDAQKIVECFELSEDILNGMKDLEEFRADIDDLCYNEDWEDRLIQAIEDGTTDDFFHDLMRESGIRLENDPIFSAFKQELQNKLK